LPKLPESPELPKLMIDVKAISIHQSWQSWQFANPFKAVIPSGAHIGHVFFKRASPLD